MAMPRLARFIEKFQSRVLYGLVPTWQEGRELPSPQDYYKLGDEGYRQSSLIYSCIREIANSASQPKLVACRKMRDGTSEPLDPMEDPLAQLISRPNTEHDLYMFLEILMIHLHVAGNAYIHKMRSGRRNVVSLWPLRPDRIEIKPGANGKVTGYQYNVGGKKEELIPAEDVIHIKFPDPVDDYYGLSPISVLARWGDIDIQTSDFLRAFFLNRGVPSGVLKLQDRVQKEERERIKHMWHEQYSGQRGWHNLAVLDGGAEYQAIAHELNQMDLSGVFNQSESRICMVFGVPPILIGSKTGLESSTYSNYSQAVESFWLETLIPLYTRISRRMTARLAEDEFGLDRELKFDLSEVSVLQEGKDSLRAHVIEGWDKGLLTRNEARIKVGMPEVEGGDIFRESITQLPISADNQLQLFLPNGSLDNNGHIERLSYLSLNGHHIADDDDDEYSGLDIDEQWARNVDDPPDDDIFLLVHAVADRLEAGMRREFLDAIASIQSRLDVERIAAALQSQLIDEAISLVPWNVITDQLGPELSARFERALTQVGQGAAREFVAQTGLDVVFKTGDPRLAGIARDQSARLVRYLSDTGRSTLRDVLARGIESGQTPMQIASEIKDVIGLLPQQELQLQKFRQLLIDQGVSSQQIATRTDRVARALLRRRSVTIARTELIDVANEGQELFWRQLIDDGVVDEDEWRKFWITALDDRLDSVCESIPSMNPNGVRINESFNTPSGPRRRPTVHPRCRCTLDFRKVESLIGAGA